MYVGEMVKLQAMTSFTYHEWAPADLSAAGSECGPGPGTNRKLSEEVRVCVFTALTVSLRPLLFSALYSFTVPLRFYLGSFVSR